MMGTILDNISAGKYDRKQLETLLKNAAKKGGHEDVIDACNSALAKLPKRSRVGSKARPSGEIAEAKDGYVIMASAYSKSGELLRPDLIPVAVELSKHPLVEDVAIMKTQIRLYLKGRHMVSGTAREGGYWFGLLDESKVTDSTIKNWQCLGEIKRGIYFDTNYVNVRIGQLGKIGEAIDMVTFT